MANEAKIGNTEYATLKEAFAAAKKGDTVTLLTDITLTEQINVTDQEVLSGITLDGAGHTITCATTDDPSQSGGSALYFGNANAGKWATGVSIKNLNMEGKARYAIFLCGGTTSNFENVNISGEYYIAINLYGTHGATFKNCDISNSFDGAYYDATVWANVAAQNPIILENSTIDKITINGYTEANTLAPKIFVDKNSSTTVISLDDGSVSHNKTLGVSQTSEGNVTIKTLDNETFVENYVAEVNGVKYGTIGAALAAAQDGDTITLLSDISLDQTLTIDKAVSIESAAGSAFTIKAGPSMAATNFNSMALLNIKNAGVSLKNLTLDGNGQSGMTLIWTNQAKGLTLDSCTLKNSRNAIYAGTYNGGTVKINNCSIIAQIYAFHGNGMDNIEVTDSKIYGWTSFSSSNAAAAALFKDCFFGAGDDTGKNGLVAALRPYFNAVVEGCTFTEAFTKFTEGYYEENGLSLGTANTVMDLTNCKIVTESGEESTLALAKLISTDYTAAAGNANPNTAFAFDAVKDENGKYISGIFCGDSEVITKNLAAGLAAVANEDGTYTPTAVDMNNLLVNEKWAETYKVGDLVQEGFYFGVNAFAKANDAINAAGANATIKIQDARDYNTPITRASYTENLTIEKQEKGYSQLYMTVSGTTYTYGEEDENGNAVRHDATVEYKGQDIFFGGHSHFESLAGMTVKFTTSEITHEGGTPFFKVYGDSNVIFDGANYANDNGNLWFYVSGQLDLQNSSNLETDGGSGFRILAAGGKVNVDKSSLLRVLGSNISIGSYYVYSDKTAKAVVGGKKQGHDADGNNDYSATLNITNGAGLVNENGIVRVGASYILDNATTDELEGLTITNNPDKPANYAELAKAYLNITDGSAAELDKLYVDGNGVVTIRNSELTANSITLANGSSLTLDVESTVTVGALTAADGTITIDASSYTSGLYKLIDIIGDAKVDYSKILTAFGENFTVIDNDLWIGSVDRSTIMVDAAWENLEAGTAVTVEGKTYIIGFNAFSSLNSALATARDFKATTVSINSDITEALTDDYLFTGDLLLTSANANGVTVDLVKTSPLLALIAADRSNSLTFDSNVTWKSLGQAFAGYNYYWNNSTSLVVNGSVSSMQLWVYGGGTATINSTADYFLGYGDGMLKLRYAATLNVFGDLTTTDVDDLSSLKQQLHGGYVSGDYNGDKVINLKDTYMSTTWITNDGTGAFNTTLDNSILKLTRSSAGNAYSAGSKAEGALVLKNASRLIIDAKSTLDNTVKSSISLSNGSTITAGILNTAGTVNVKTASKIKADSIVNSGLIHMIDEESSLEADNLELKDKVDKEIWVKLYDGATAVIHDTLTVGKGAEFVISGSNLGACSVTAKNVIHNGSMTIGGHSELIAENLTVSAGSEIWGMSGSMITVTNSLVVENYGDLYFTIGSVAGDADVVTLIKGYEGIDYTNVDVRSSEGYVKVVGNDNNLYAIRGDSSTLYANAAWDGHEMGTAVDGIAGSLYGFNAFASAENMFDNIRDTTTTLKLFGEQELITDAAIGAANNRNFNIRAKQDLTLTADDAATLTLTVKDSDWVHGGSTHDVGELAFLSDSDDAVQTITIGENVTIDTNAKIWFGRTAVTKEVHATNIVINGSIIQKPHKDATSEHPNASLYGIQQIQVEKGSTVTLNGSMLFGWSLLVKGGIFNVTENASLTWDVDAFAQTNGNVEVESRDTTGGQFNVSGSKNVKLRSLTIKDSASSASFTNGAEAVFIDYITLAEGSSITIDAASTITTGTLTNNGTITIDATGVTSGSHKVIDTDAIAGTGSITAKDGTLSDDMNLVIADNDIYLTDQNQDVIYVGGVNAAGEKSANTNAPSEALQGWNKFDTMKDAFEAGALGYNTIDFGNAGRVVSDKAFTYTKETIELGEGEYTITNGAGAYLPRLTMNARDVVINIKKAHVTLAKYRSGKDANGELGGAVLSITDSRVDGGNEVDGLMWVTSYADSIIEITNSRVGLLDSYTGEAENVTLGNTGSYLDWGSYGNLALKVSGTAVIKDSTIFAGYYFSTIGDADGATIDVTNSVVYASAVETDGSDGMASLRLNNSALRQSGWDNGTENYNFLVKKGATVSLNNGSNLWWARAAQVRSPYGGDLRDSVVIDADGTLELFGGSTAEVGNITNNGELVIYESTLKALTITNNGYFAINNNSAISAEFSTAGTGFISIQDAVFGADTVINASASYTNQGIGSEIVMFGHNRLNGANISTGWSKDLRIGFGTNFPYADISITEGAKLTVGGNTYIGSATEDQGATYTVFVTGAGSEFNGSGASGDLYLRADGKLTIQNEASASFTYFNGKGVLNVSNATFKALNFNIADSGKLTFVNGAKVSLGSSDDAKKNSTARGDISVGGDETELNLIGDIEYGRTNTAADFTVKNNASVTVNGNIKIGYFTQTSSVYSFYKGSLSLTDNAKFTTTGTITVFLDSAIAMDYTSRLTFGGLTAPNGAITIDVSGYTDGIYMVMENTGSNAVDYATVISNWSEIENIGYTIVDNALYIGKADSENYLVNADYSKYKFGDAIEGKTGYFYGFNAFSSLDDAGRAAKEATKTITVEADLTEDVNTPLFDLKGDLILTADAPVTVTWNVIGNADDAPDTDGKFYLVSKDGLNHTFTIGENVTLNVPQSSWGGAFYVGYQSAWATKLNIDGKVNTYLFYIGSKSEVTISETGSLTTSSENLIMRWDSKLTVNGNGTLDENNPQVKLSYASIQGGDLVLNNTVMNAGSWLQMWNRNKVDGKQAPTLTLDNSILIAGGLTARDAEEAVISLSNNSTVKINGNAANAGTMSVKDSVLYVNGTLTNSGTLNVYGESTISTVDVANTGMIILNDGTTLIDSTIMDSTENTVAYGNVTVKNGYFGTLVFSGNSGASVNGTLEGSVYVDNLMVDRRYNDAVSDDITGTLTVKADANIGVSKHMYNKVGSTTVIEANAIVTVTGELQNKGTINVEGFLNLFSENGLGESVAGRDKNKGVMNVNGGNVYYADSSSSNGWFGIGAKIHNAGWQDVEEAGSEMNLSNNALLDLTFNGGNEYPGKYGAAFAIGTGASLNVESGSTVNADSALLNKGTVNLDETSKITVGNLLNEATGKISVKAGNDVSFKAGALTNNGEFIVDAGTYLGGTVKVIDLDSITGAEIIVNNIDSDFVYRGDDGDILLSNASKDILKGNSSWTAEFGEAVAGAGNGFYMGVNAFNNADKLSAEFKRDESVKKIQLTERLTGKLSLERGVTISTDRFFGEEAFLGGTDAEYTLNVSYNQTWERFEIDGQNVTVTLNNTNSASLQAHTLNIFSGAEVIVADGATLYASEVNTSGATTGGTLNNWGTITLETGSALQVGRDGVVGRFNNYGLINVDDATITVAADFKNEGTITVSAGSTVETSEFFINKGTFNLNWNATLKMGNFDATSSSITIDMTGFDNKERALVVVANQTLDEATVISIVGQDFYNKYKGYLRYDGNTLYLTENLSAEVYVSSDWAGKGQGETVDYNGNTYTIGTNAFGTVSDAQSVNPLLIHIVGGTITGTTVLDGQKTILEGDATYTAVVLAGARVAAGVDNRVTIDGDTNVTVNSGTFKSHLIGADGQISGSIRRNGNVTLTINGGDFEKQVAGGMYFYAQNPFDEAVLNGDVNMTINGGTFVKRVYGGCFTQLENEYTAQTKIVGDINLTIDASVNTITFNDMVTAGSRGTGRIYGNINVKVTGASSNLNFTTKLIGDSNAAGYYNTANGYTEQTYVSGDRIVEFANFQGDFNAELIMFKTLNFSEGTNMTFTSVRLDVSNVSEWNFGFGTELNINAGLNSFEGDELAFGLDGWDNSSDWTAINGAKDSMIAGWDKAGSVSFILNGSEYAASWDAAAGAWCNSELGVKLGLGDDQKSLLISKLA